MEANLTGPARLTHIKALFVFAEDTFNEHTRLGEKLNPRRKPLIALIVAGAVVALTLTFVPYTLTLLARAGQSVVNAVAPSGSSEVADSAVVPPAPPPVFDVAAWYAAREEEPEKHGVHVESLDGQRVFATHNADNAFNPASLVKLATSLAALRKLGPDYRFETRVFIEGEPDASGTLRGRVYVAGGDPTFGDVAGAFVARELRARGIAKVTGGVAVTPEFCFNFSESPQESAERLQLVMELDGKNGAAKKVDVKTETKKSDAKKSPAVKGVGKNAEEKSVEASGVEQSPNVVGTPTGKYLFSLKSYPLREVLLYMNAHSSNFVAERVGALVGGATGIEQFLEAELKLPPEQVHLATASGREQNRMNARGVVAVVRALDAEAKRHGMRLEDLMPVASDDSGTLRRRLSGTPLEGATVGKTGTLTAEVDGGMASLAGVVYTQNAGAVVFAILDQGNRIWESRQLEDQLLNDVFAASDQPVNISDDTPRRQLPQTSLRIEPEMIQGTTQAREFAESDVKETGETSRKQEGKTRDANREVGRSKDHSRREKRVR